MRLAYIVPTKWIGEYGNRGDFHLALSHLIELDEQTEYEKELLASGKEIMLDNGTYEHGIPEEVDTLLLKAVKIKASHVFAPDYLHDAKKTRDAFERMVVELEKLPIKPKLAVVIQAATVEEFIEEYSKYVDDDRVSLIGLSILAIPYVVRKHLSKPDMSIEMCRMYIINVLNRKIKNHKNSHLLGLGSSFKDVILAKATCPWIVSNDTSSAFQNGLYLKRLVGNNLEVERGKIKIKMDFHLQEITDQQKSHIDFNFKNIDKILCN